MKKPSPKGKTIWCIRAGQQGAAHNLFIERSLIVLAEQGFGDLRNLPKNRESFYSTYAKRHADEGSTAIAGIGGTFFRFIHEIHNGDLVLYPCLLDKKVHYGVVSGPYAYAKSQKEFPHHRKVIWNGAFEKSNLSEFARRELGAARTLFKVNNNAEEIRAVICKLSAASLTQGGGKPKKVNK